MPASQINPIPVGDSVPAVGSAPEAHEPVPPHEAAPGVPRELSDLVARLLANGPGRRPASAREVAKALRAVEARLARPPVRWASVMGLAAVALALLAGVVAGLVTRVGSAPGDRRRAQPYAEEVHRLRAGPPVYALAYTP